MLMYRMLLVMLAVGLVCGVSSACGDEVKLAGTYSVQGWEPEGDRSSTPDYTGTITVSRFGEAYRMTGQVDGEEYAGIGFAGDDGVSFSFSYRCASGDTGLAAGQYRNGIWIVFWISTDTKTGRPGQELWAPVVVP